MSDNANLHSAQINGICETTNGFLAQPANEEISGSLNLLLFSVGGVHFGVDAGHVSSVNAYDDSQSQNLSWFHEELQYGDAAVKYISPTVITIRTAGSELYRVVIDSMTDIAEFNLDDIHLFPAMLEPFALKKGMWGIICRNGTMVLLIDFQLLYRQKRSEIN